MLRRIAVSYFAGALAAIVSAVCLWLAARAGLLTMLGVALAPKITWPWLSHRILWGGIWGLGYPLVARMRYRPVRAGLMLSLAPSLAQLFYFFPRDQHSLLGVDLGPLTPIVVLGVNAIWGWALARVVLATGERGAGA
jgi:hypothetical protein